MKPEYIKNFEKLGIGLFVHFGLYSIVGKGEWYFNTNPKCNKEKYVEELPKKFKIKKNWAKELVKTAKKAGAKYITLTTRHHDGFSLYDTKGLSEFDVMHSATKRDLIREFVDECNKEGIIPFFYHTLLDWTQKDYEKDFKKYLVYLRSSVEMLCRDYGKIGGLWFDGSWSRPNIDDWEFDKLYAVIRKYQPEAMIINNTGLVGEGEISHSEIDSVTFERGKPTHVKTNGKEIAGEMCDGINDHWGYTKLDIVYKPAKYLIKSLVDCRHFNCNYLINTGLMGNGSVNLIDKCLLEELGTWIKANKGFVYNAKGSNLVMENAVALEDDEFYYCVIHDVPMCANGNVTKMDGTPVKVHIDLQSKIKGAKYLDNNKKVSFIKGEKNTFIPDPFEYGISLGSRVIKFKK